MKNVVNEIADTYGFTKKLAGEIVDSVVEKMVKEILDSKKLRVSGLGTFSVKERAARKARNPKTDEVIDVPAKNVVTFKMAKDLKETV